jgi:geranylgeranyl transferase type-1 subunit beta
MSTFNKKKHATYWLRCLKTFLPNQYTSMDTNRTMLAFFAISALDILNVLNNSTTVEERASYTEWIYSLQHPQGGFRGSPSMQFGSMAEEDQLRWDTASVPATYFALAMLLILRDDFERVKRDDCLKWLRCMQREDGSFGQTLGYNGSVEGGHDTRFGYVAMGIRWILGGDLPQIASSEVQDINTEKLVMNIRQLQTYDGGFSDVPFHEAHGGYTYCAISALSISNSLDDGIADHELLLRWLIVRQTRNIDPDEDDEEDCKVQFSSPSPIGFNGRCNKVGDTCYTFWIAGALKVCLDDI